MANFDQHALCPHCNEPMCVRITCWVYPGEDFDVGDVDYESSTSDSNQWWCDTCKSHHFPLPQEEKQLFF